MNQTIISLLKDYGELEDNWDGEGAKKPNLFSLNQAIYLTEELTNLNQNIYHVAPGPNGEIMLNIRNENNSKSIEIIFYENISIQVLFSDNNKPIQDSFEFTKLNNLLNWLNETEINKYLS